MTLEIFKIRSDSRNNVLINDVKKLLPNSASRLQTVINNRVESIGRLGVQALRSKVPIDTGELRNQHIYLSGVASKENPMTTVIIDGDDHTSFGKRRPIAASALAFILDATSKGKRSQSSKPIDPFSDIGKGQPHTGWIKSAKIAFFNALRSGKY